MRFKRNDGRDVWINPAQVVFVEASDAQNTRVYLAVASNLEAGDGIAPFDLLIQGDAASVARQLGLEEKLR